VDSVLWNAIDERIRQSDVDGAIALLEELLDLEKGNRFAGLIGAQFTNRPEQVLAFINKFIRRTRPRACWAYCLGRC